MGRTGKQIANNPNFMKGYSGIKSTQVGAIKSRELNVSKSDRSWSGAKQYTKRDVELFKVMWDEGKTFREMIAKSNVESDVESFLSSKLKKLRGEGNSEEEIYNIVRPTIQNIKDIYYPDLERVHQKFRRVYSDSDVEYLRNELEKGRRIPSISRDEDFLVAFKAKKKEDLSKDASLSDTEISEEVIKLARKIAHSIKYRKIGKL